MVVMAVAVCVAMVMGPMAGMIVFVFVFVIVIVFVGHWSIPVAGSAMCSSMSASTPLMWASAVE